MKSLYKSEIVKTKILNYLYKTIERLVMAILHNTTL